MLAAPPVAFFKVSSPAVILLGLSNLEKSQVTVIKSGNELGLLKPLTWGTVNILSAAKPSSPP